jgi:hypothetical protein
MLRTLIAERAKVVGMVDYDVLFWSKADKFGVPVVFLKRLIGRPSARLSA